MMVLVQFDFVVRESHVEDVPEEVFEQPVEDISAWFLENRRSMGPGVPRVSVDLERLKDAEEGTDGSVLC